MAAKKTDRELLENIAKDEKDIKKRIGFLEKKVKKEVTEEETIEETEKEELGELEKLEEIEEEIKKDVTPHPLKRITYHDITKGIVGAFVGVVGHFAFVKGKDVAAELTIARANALMITSLLLLLLFIYFTGFRRIVKDRRFKYVPIRVAVIYVTALAVATFVLLLFGSISLEMGHTEIYKNIAAVSLLAVMGAATADLIGGE